MLMSPAVRKLALTTHVAASVGWVGALAVFLAHALANLSSNDEHIVRATAIAMSLTAWLVILPLSLAAVATGILQALGTAWGLLRHYWIIFKLLLTVLATGILLLKLKPIDFLAAAAQEATFPAGQLVGLRTSLTIHAAGGLLVLLVVLVLAIYKPPGVTSFGQSKPKTGAHASGEIRTIPTWVKVFSSFAVLLIFGVAAMVLLGSHGPAAHGGR